MIEQLKHLLRAAEAADIRIRAIPNAIGAYAGLLGAFMLVDFVYDRPTVHLEQRCAIGILDAPDDVAVFVETTEHLRELALGESDSRRLIKNYVRQYEQRQPPE